MRHYRFNLVLVKLKDPEHKSSSELTEGQLHCHYNL
jgi:hypothetical protein